MIRALATLVLFGALMLSGPRAGADELEQRFRDATELMGQERYDEAALALVALADDAPASAFADDALFTAAQLFEERLGDPVRALALYRRLTRDYSDSRSALAASRRAAALRQDLGPDAEGAEALAKFNEIRRSYPDRKPAASIALMEQLIADYPRWPGLPRALLWLAEVHTREGDLAAAEARYAEVATRWPDSDHAFEANRGAAQIAILDGRLGDAKRFVDAMDTGDDPGKMRSVDDLRARLRRARHRETAYAVSFAVLAAALLILLGSLWLASGSPAAAARALARPPTEAIYFLPVAAVLFGAALTGHEQIAPATLIILIGGLVIAWISGAGLALARSPRRVLVHIAASLAGTVAVVYIAIHRTRLLDLILQTVRFGPDH